LAEVSLGSLNGEALKSCRLGSHVDVPSIVVEWLHLHPQPREFLQRVSVWCLSDGGGGLLFLACTTLAKCHTVVQLAALPLGRTHYPLYIFGLVLVNYR
jgi:hypothetical protein